MRRLVPATAAAAAVVVLAAAAMAAPSVAITSPASGDTISRSATPTLQVRGTAATVTPGKSDQTWYLRRSQCASGADDARLSTERGGSTEQTGCGFLAQPLNEVLISQDGAGLSTSYAAADGMPITLDASSPITGRIAVNGGVGVVTIELALRGTTSDRRTVTLLEKSETFNGTAGTRNVDLSAVPDATLDKVDLTALELWFRVRGANVQAGSINHRNGASWINVPTWSASFNPTVEVALNSTGFTQRVTRASLAQDGTWTATIPTPAAGQHTLSARLTQGALRQVAEPLSITVTQ